MSQSSPEPVSPAVPTMGLETVAHLDPLAARGVLTTPADTSRGAISSAPPGYEILEILGRGGMGIVYKARQIALNRLVAIKMILSGSHAGEQEVARFRSEAETIARLRHPHIVQIYEVGEFDGRLFCTLELAEGGTLGQRLSVNPLSPREAAVLVEKLADAVQAAHDAGIIHRDLKPANVLLTEVAEPQAAIPKITDFGLAKRLDDESGRTQTGAVMGTPSYMSPEQASGLTSSIGPAADIYSLGAILYECLTGRPPFRAAVVLDTLEQVRSQEPVAPSRLQPTVPRDLETICLKCLRKDPTRRYPSAHALADDLKRFRNDEPIQARPVSTWERSWKWARRRPVLAALAGALAASVIALVVLAAFVLVANEKLKEQTALAESSADRAAEKVIRLHVGTGARHLLAGDLMESIPSFAAAFHEERKRAASDDSPEMEMHRLRLALAMRQCPRPVQLWTSDETFLGAMFSARGDRVMAHTVKGATVWDVRTGERVGYARSEKHLSAASLSPDGTILAMLSAEGTIRMLDAATGKLRHECRADVSAPQRFTFRFSHDGKDLMTAAGNAILRWDVRTGLPRPGAIGEPTELKDARYGHDGTLLVTVGRHTVGVWDSATSKKVWSFDAPNAEHAAISARGKYLVAKSLDSARIWRLDSGAMVSSPYDPGYSNSLVRIAISPDEQRVAVVTSSGLRSSVRLWDIALSRPMFHPLVIEEPVVGLHYTPDGSALAIVTLSGEVHLRDGMSFKPTLPPFRDEGTGSRFITESKLAFSSDGRLMLLRGESTIRLWDLAVGTTRRASVTTETLIEDSYFSGDGGRSAVLSNLPKTGWSLQLFDARTATPLAPALFGEGKHPRMSVSSDVTRAVVWTVGGGSGATLCDFSKEKPVAVPLPTSRRLESAHFSRDGRRVLIASSDDKGGIVETWDAGTGRRIATPVEVGVLEVAVSPDGRRLAAVSTAAETLVRIRDCDSGEEIGDPLSHSHTVRLLTFSADGSRLATATDSEVRVWDVADGTPIVPPLQHTPILSCLRFSPDGTILATIGGGSAGQRIGSEVRLWDVRTGSPVCSPIAFRNTVFDSLLFRKDGRLLLLGARDGTCCLLDPATGEPVSPLLNTLAGDHSRIANVAFSPDEREIRVFGIDDASIRSWDLTPLDSNPDAVDLLSSLLGRQKPGPDGKIVAITSQQQERDWRTLRADMPSAWLPSKEEQLTWRSSTAYRAIRYGQYSVALRHLDVLLEALPDDRQERLRRVRCRRELKLWDEALADLGFLLQRHGDDPEIRRQRGTIHGSMGRWDLAETDYSEAIKRDPTRGVFWHERGMTKVHREQWAGAASDFERALSCDDARRTWWMQRVPALVGAKDEKAARAACAAAWNDNSTGLMHPHEQLELAVLFPDVGLNSRLILEEALAAWRKNSRGVQENVLYGAALLRAGEFDKAAERLEAVRRVPGGDWVVPAGYFLAVTRLRQGKPEDARRVYEEAVRRHEHFVKGPLEKGATRREWTWQQYVMQLRTEAERMLKEK